MPSKTAEPEKSVESQLDEILVHLRKMDKRDRMRTWGGFVRSLIALIPLLFVVWSAWYFMGHWSEIMKQVADQAASSAAEYTKKQSQGMFDKFMDQYSVPKQ